MPLIGFFGEESLWGSLRTDFVTAIPDLLSFLLKKGFSKLAELILMSTWLMNLGLKGEGSLADLLLGVERDKRSLFLLDKLAFDLSKILLAGVKILAFFSIKLFAALLSLEASVSGNTV